MPLFHIAIAWVLAGHVDLPEKPSLWITLGDGAGFVIIDPSQYLADNFRMYTVRSGTSQSFRMEHYHR